MENKLKRNCGATAVAIPILLLFASVFNENNVFFTLTMLFFLSLVIVLISFKAVESVAKTLIFDQTSF